MQDELSSPSNPKQRLLLDVKLPYININSIYENLNKKKSFIDNYENIIDMFSTDNEKNQIFDKRRPNNIRNEKKNFLVKNRTSMAKDKIGNDQNKNKIIFENKINVKNYKTLNNFESNIYTSYIQDDLDFMKTLLASIENKKNKKRANLLTKSKKLEILTNDSHQNYVSTKESDNLPYNLETVKSRTSMNSNYHVRDLNMISSRRNSVKKKILF